MSVVRSTSRSAECVTGSGTVCVTPVSLLVPVASPDYGRPVGGRRSTRALVRSKRFVPRVVRSWVL